MTTPETLTYRDAAHLLLQQTLPASETATLWHSTPDIQGTP